jgi:hypothetical protein
MGVSPFLDSHLLADIPPQLYFPLPPLLPPRDRQSPASNWTLRTFFPVFGDSAQALDLTRFWSSHAADDIRGAGSKNDWQTGRKAHTTRGIKHLYEALRREYGQGSTRSAVRAFEQIYSWPWYLTALMELHPPFAGFSVINEGKQQTAPSSFVSLFHPTSKSASKLHPTTAAAKTPISSAPTPLLIICSLSAWPNSGIGFVRGSQLLAQTHFPGWS